MLFAFTMLMGCVRTSSTGRRASPPRSSSWRARRVKAVAMNTIGFSMMRIFGPALAGFLIACVRRGRQLLHPGRAVRRFRAMVFFVVVSRRARARGNEIGARHECRGLRFAANEPAHACPARGRRAAVLPARAGVGHAASRSMPRTCSPPGRGARALLTGVGVGGTLGGFVANALARAERQGADPGGVDRADGPGDPRPRGSPTLAARARLRRDRRRGRDGAHREQHGDAAA